MAVNRINTRIQLKYDTFSNWYSSSFTPLKGEVCIAEIPRTESQSGLIPPTIGIKVGDGVNKFQALPWIQALAGDVHSWAKQDSVVNAETRADLQDLISKTINDSNTLYKIRRGTGVDINKYFLQKKDKNEAEYSDVQDSVIDLSDILSNLTGIMRFIGFSTTEITDGGTENPTINGNIVTTLKNGDVVIYQEAQEIASETVTIIAKEFVWTGSNWELLGDEGSYAIKGSITNSDIASNANIDQSKINGLTSALNSKIEGIQVPDGMGTRDLTITNKKIQLSKIAETGNVNDLLQDAGDFLILNCGDASHFIANPT